MKTGSKIIISVIVVIALIAGGFTYLNYSNSNTGKVSVYVEDAPILNVSAVYITFANFSLHNTSSGWSTHSVKTTTVNILGLTTTNASLLGIIKRTLILYMDVCITGIYLFVCIITYLIAIVAVYIL